MQYFPVYYKIAPMYNFANIHAFLTTHRLNVKIAQVQIKLESNATHYTNIDGSLEFYSYV